MAENDPKLSQDLEEITDEEFSKDMKRFKETHTEENFAKIENYVSEAHDKAYIAFKSKFEELADHKDDPLAKMGEEISDKHLNDLLETYVHEFIKSSHGKTGEALVENYKKLKFTDENERSHHLQQLAEHSGLDTGSKNPEENPYLAMASTLKMNKNRHHGVVNDFARDIKQVASGRHKGLLWKETLGKDKYRRRSDLMKKALDDISSGRYDIDHDDDGKSKFYQFDTHQLAQTFREIQLKGQMLNKDKLKDYGLKEKPAEYKGK